MESRVNPRNGLFVRVGIDSTDGNWNAPVRVSSGEFAFVTITENDAKTQRGGFGRRYDEFIPVLQRFGPPLPGELHGRLTHLDPDFDYLTYGDQGQRAKRISEHLGNGDLLAFFSALRPIDGPQKPLIYALIGLYIIDEIVAAQTVPQAHWHENAHTRRVPDKTDIIVRAKPGVSGRLRHCIPIGEWRSGSYRVRRDLLETWGDLDIKDGFIQRSVRLPAFKDAEKFYHWFLKQSPELIPENNPL